MKLKMLRVGFLSIAAGGVVFISGCVVRPDGRVAFAPIIIAAPQPVYIAPEPVYIAPEPMVEVPDAYAWDGVEYVGLVGGQYYYLGPGDRWLIADSFRLGRFHGWERDHRDWRDHAIRNDRFRTDHNGRAQPGHAQPGRSGPARGGEKKRDEGH